MICANENNLVLTIEQHVEMTAELTHILFDMYGLDGPLETEVDEHGNEYYTEYSQERFDLFTDDAERILLTLGFSREDEDE
tara:strand:- start:79 stop:321 length:243 start_codon:yes stop_codon:yes gene_type:complete